MLVSLIQFRLQDRKQQLTEISYRNQRYSTL